MKNKSTIQHLNWNCQTKNTNSFNRVGKTWFIQIIDHWNIEHQWRRSLCNLNDDKPELIFGPEVNGKYEEGGVPPFYISLSIHDQILHNAMLDSGASHNLMPKEIMENLNLDITRPYKDHFSFDSSKVNVLA